MKTYMYEIVVKPHAKIGKIKPIKCLVQDTTPIKARKALLHVLNEQDSKIIDYFEIKKITRKDYDIMLARKD